jgi:exopolyphosphatase / guanosine-5'-triphosphate,3'-diphosphate pyrophosphatase
MSRHGISGEPNRPLVLDPERARSDGRPHFAIVDIGSNSVRLVVYDRLGRAPFPRFNEKSLCRLGAGLDQTGELSAESFRRTVEAMRRFRAIADAMDVPRIEVIATEAVRRASNGDRLVAAIADEAGFTVRVLSGAEEAHYAALGVIAGFHRPTGLVGDMGGGSLEVAEIADDRVGTGSVSLPLGALPVQALLAKGRGDAKRRLDSLLRQKLPPSLKRPVFYAVGGGWRAFAQMHMESVAAPVRVAHGYTLDAGEARTFARTVWRMPEAKLAALPGVPARRVPTLPAAALVLDRVLKRLAPERVAFSALGVREGWLYAQLATDEQNLDPLVEGAQSFGIPHARVPAFAPALVCWTDALFPDETPRERRLRVAACALSDIGWRDHASVKAAESFRRLIQFPLVALDHAERVFLAAVIHARYAGRANDPALAPAIDVLPPSARRRALILGRVLLLGYRVSGGVPEILASAHLQIGADVVRLAISKVARVPDSEVVGDRLGLVASAVGVRRTEIVEAASEPDREGPAAPPWPIPR